jgi:hypothetical protein
MTVAHDDDGPRLSEIARTLSDFRHEFRAAMTEVVRKDVYGAHMSGVQLQIDNLAKENKRLADEIERESKWLLEEIERDRVERATDRREVRKAFLTASLSVVVALILLVVQLVIK